MPQIYALRLMLL